MPPHPTPGGLPPGTVTARHPGDWRLHHIAVPECAGDFTPVRVPGYHEARLAPGHDVLEFLADLASLRGSRQSRALIAR